MEILYGEQMVNTCSDMPIRHPHLYACLLLKMGELMDIHIELFLEPFPWNCDYAAVPTCDAY
ncbi:hypothetical protein [Herbaspirillum chlorophenolicum]|uniref:hypothetical protein n=1 Tax=Herbaspirillum chlorophenolicum TaxID=211589 RepID=UPI0012E2596E|nr:hypothetical protein [Herbaspirillum chlorophenolicum]